MSLTYEPSLEPLHNSAKWLFFNRELQVAVAEDHRHGQVMVGLDEVERFEVAGYEPQLLLL